MEIPSIQKMVQLGMHFGHRISKQHPKMSPYIFGARKGIHILNLEITQKKIEEALDFVKDLIANQKVILFVGTKKQIAPIIEKYAKECEMPYISTRWLGGTLTNFSSIFGLIKKFRGLKEMEEKGELAKYTKEEQNRFKKIIKKQEKIVGGIANLTKIPDALFIVDLKREKTAVIEAKKKGVPVIGICDTNVNPTNVKYPIPASDDSVAGVELIVSLVAEAVKEGRKNQKPEKPQEQNQKSETSSKS
jgi:small subunit ribosomal protein S2